MQHAELKQNTQQWLNWRKDKIGASDIPIILGLSSYCTPYLLWRRKLGFAEEQKETYTMQRGKDLEPLIREKINLTNDYNFTPEVLIHKDISWAIASLDGIDKNRKTLLEIKCTSKENHELAHIGELCEAHFVQVQWQLFVSDYDFLLYAHYFNDDIILVEVKRDDNYIQSVILTAALNFYKCLVNIEPPEIKENEHVLIQDSVFEEYAIKWKEVSQAKKHYDKLEKEYREKLISLSDDGNCIGGGIKLSRINREGTIDWQQLWKTLEAQYPELCEKINLENYRKESIGYWKIEALD